MIIYSCTIITRMVIHALLPMDVQLNMVREIFLSSYFAYFATQVGLTLSILHTTRIYCMHTQGTITLATVATAVVSALDLIARV